MASISASINTGGVAGFDIGSGASLTFSGTSSVLNIDASGTPSEILGQLSAGGPLYVANANGIVVGSTATITAPQLGLLNASLGSNATSVATSFSSGTLDLSFTGVTGGVNIVSGADLSGVLTSVGMLVAGADTVNVNFAGYKGATEATLNIDGGIPATVNVGSGTMTISEQSVTLASGSNNTYTYSSLGAPVHTTVNLGLGETGTTYLTTAPFSFSAGSQIIVSGDLVNSGLLGALDASGSVTYGSMPGQLEWTGTFTNNGTIETNTTTFLSSTNAAASVAYSLSSTGASVAPLNGNFVNASVGVLNIDGDLLENSGNITNSGSITFDGSTIQTGTAGSIVNSGTISTNMAPGTFTVLAGNSASVSLGGTIDFTSTASGAYTLGVFAGTGIDYSAALSYGSTGSSLATATFNATTGDVTLASPLVATGLVYAKASAGNVNIASSGSISAGTVDLYASGASAGNVTIAGAINASSEIGVGAANAINVASSGPITVSSTNSPVNAIFGAGSGLTIDAPVTVSSSNGDADVIVNLYNTSAATNFSLGSSGSVFVSAASGSTSNFSLDTSTSTKTKPLVVVDNGKITAGSVALGNYSASAKSINGGSISSITGSGSITTGNLTVGNLLGNFNNATGSNPLKNGFALSAMGTSPMNVSWSTAGGSKQAINLNITGSALLNATNIIGTSTGSIVSGGTSLVTPNAGSNLLIQSTGNLQVGTTGSSFNFPGGIALVANSITQDATVYNGWSTVPVAFQGIFYTAPTVTLNNNNFYTNASTWVNFSAAPNVLPTVFTLNFANNAYSYLPVPNTSTGSLVHQNNYTTLANTAAAGGNWVAQVNTTPISSLGQFVAASATTTTQK
ncbi:hypothetical protein HF669_03375 [Acidithiobacillus thiooxidans]|uniref:beta strand repeat-containing protein n=1 Tax=Acidithiobacillus thiooxidans TaxID=930 RepID=UPI000262544A|nr:hypothetical protein [Acidithiobacillus thiooxidans]MBU2810434.1 hypothetical protein [Acidithiobacillus thiooxidans]